MAKKGVRVENNMLDRNWPGRIGGYRLSAFGYRPEMLSTSSGRKRQNDFGQNDGRGWPREGTKSREEVDVTLVRAGELLRFGRGGEVF